jgi:hypothetical protein
VFGQANQRQVFQYGKIPAAQFALDGSENANEKNAKAEGTVGV